MRVGVRFACAPSLFYGVAVHSSMNRLVALLFTGLLLVSGAACDAVGLSSGSHGEDRPLVGPTWQLFAFEDEDGGRTLLEPTPSAYADVAYTVVFTERPADADTYSVGPVGSHRMEVIGYPNEGVFTYERAADRALSIYFHAATEIAPPPGSREADFFNALAAATRYRIESDRLRLVYDDGKALLFKARE